MTEATKRIVSLGALLVRHALRYAPRFDGRATRTELGLTISFCFGASASGVLLTDFGSGVLRDANAALLTVLIGLPLLAVMIRRLHDTSRTGWALFTAAFPYVGIFILGFLLLSEGDPHENAFGPEPGGSS